MQRSLLPISFALLAGAIPAYAQQGPVPFGPGPVPACPLSGCTFTGPVVSTSGGTALTLAGTASMKTVNATHLSAVGNISYSGASDATNSLLWNNSFLTGTVSTGVSSILSPNVILLADQANTNGAALNAFQIVSATGGPNINGVRQGISVLESLTSTPGASMSVVGGLFGAVVHANMLGTAGGFNKMIGGSFGMNPITINYSGTFMNRVTGGEVNAAVEAGASAASFYGLSIIATADHAVSGIYDDAALVLTTQSTANPWRNGVQFGTYSGVLGFGATSTFIKAIPEVLPSWVAPISLNGVDWREVQFQSGGYAFASKGFGVDPSGNASLTALTVNGSVQSTSATLTGVSITYGGLFYLKPTLALSAPTGSGGSTATVTVSTMGVNMQTSKGVSAIIAAGSGFTAGDVLTASGGTGTAPTFTVNSVDGSGAITAVTPLTTGSMSVLPAKPAPMTGGTGTGATLELGWTILTVSISGAGSGYVATPVPVVATWAGFGAPVAGANWEPATLVFTMTGAASTLSVQPSGGALKVGSDMTIANGSVATTMTSLGPTGSHTTIQEWLAITNSSGVVRYIPAY